MKIQRVELEFFKKFHKSKSFDFTDPETGLARNIILLTGMNGSGKTSILQAIAASLGMATGRLRKLSDLKWPGFNYELLSSNWGMFESDVKITVQFSTQEINAVREFYKKLKLINSDLSTEPGEKHIVSLRWSNGRVQADTAAQLFQFKGREYAKQLRKAEGFSVFKNVGTTLWYTEQRTSTSLTTEDVDKKIEITEDVLRDRLSKWRQFHLNLQSGIQMQKLQQGQKDLYAEIERLYKIIFHGRSFVGSVLREQIDDILEEPWFYLYDGRNQYEISEMSGGERAVFPLVFDFANWNIHNSVILIDEIELHLHPPAQQALLSALPNLGENNQFIITTHSDYVEQLIPDAHIIRLEV
jgi:predicted ATP-dependent endonuclease of OLD family